MSKAELTRQFIVEKTAPIFNAQGYAGTSVSDMTTATGLTKGSIYGNFANKDEVAVAAFEHNWNRVQTVVHAAMAKGSTSTEKLLALVAVYGHFPSPAFPVGGCPLLNTAIEADDTHPGLRDKAAAALHEWTTTLRTLIASGIASKEFRADVDSEQAALTIIALIEGSIMISRLTGKAKHRKLVMPAVEKTIRDLA